MPTTRPDPSVAAALAQLDALSRNEYGSSLIEVLQDPNHALGLQRVRRLTGIVLKRPFARASELPTPSSATHAHRAWEWVPAEMEGAEDPKSAEAELLRHLRDSLPALSQRPPTWEDLRDEADHERGLFKVLAGYLADRLKGRDIQSMRAYLDAHETRTTKAVLDLATLASNFLVVSPILAAVGVPEVAVGLAVIGIRWGYDGIFAVEDKGDRAD
jgi:hypothetical protein